MSRSTSNVIWTVVLVVREGDGVVVNVDDDGVLGPPPERAEQD